MISSSIPVKRDWPEFFLLLLLLFLAHFVKEGAGGGDPEDQQPVAEMVGPLASQLFHESLQEVGLR